MKPCPIPDGALAGMVAIVGRTGSGKTTAARGAVESMLDAGRQVVVIDPAGAWYGLRTAADGQGAGFGIPILGGDHGDVPLESDSGGKLAEYLVSHRQSAVIDVSGFTLSERRRFYEGLLGALFHDNRAPMQLVVDEADELAPQRPMPDQTMVLHQMERIVRRGRVRGFRVMMITQRPAVLNKNVLSQAGCLVAMQLTAAQDRAAIGAWIEGQADRDEAKALLASLPRMATGEGWVWWPQEGPPARVRFPLARTFDSGRTPTPGADPVRLAPMGDDARAALTLALRAPADEGATTPRPGRASTATPPDAAALAAAERAGWERGWAEAWERATPEIRRLRAAIRAALEALSPHASMPSDDKIVAPGIPDKTVTPPPRAERAPPPATASANASQRIGAEMRILKVLAQRHPAALTMAQWATLSRMSRKGGTWATYLSRLRTRALIEQDGGLFRASVAGLAAAEVVALEPQTSAEVLRRWKVVLGSGPSRMLDALAAASESGMDRANLADRVGMTATGGTFATYLSRLRSNDLIVEKGRRIFIAPALVADLREVA